MRASRCTAGNMRIDASGARFSGASGPWACGRVRNGEFRGRGTTVRQNACTWGVHAALQAAGGWCTCPSHRLPSEAKVAKREV
eukprot:3313502-Prymnesium_polylepis.1